MKRKTRKILMVLAMATISAFGVLFASCGAGDWLNEKVDQLTCKHEYDDGIELESATCSEYGKVLKTCTICYYEKTEKIDKLPHTETVVAAVAPTCTKDGKTDGVVCSVCDEIIVRQKSVPKLGHDITILEAVEPTCLTSGKTEGQYCNRCNETVVAQKTISALGHKVTTTYGKAATCTESGLTNGQKCVRCDTVYVAQEVIPATGHNFEDGVECKVCGKYDVSTVATMSNLETEAVSAMSVLDCNAIYRLKISDLFVSRNSPFVRVNLTFNDSFFDSKDAEYEEAYRLGSLTLAPSECECLISFEEEDNSVTGFSLSGVSTEWVLRDGTTVIESGVLSGSLDGFSAAFSNDMSYFYFTFSDVKSNQGDLSIENICCSVDLTILEKVIL